MTYPITDRQVDEEIQAQKGGIKILAAIFLIPFIGCTLRLLYVQAWGLAILSAIINISFLKFIQDNLNDKCFDDREAIREKLSAREQNKLNQ